MDKPPHYLSKAYHQQNSNDPIDPNEQVGSEELLYRRVKDQDYPNKEYFTGLQSAIFNEETGFSVNRSKYSQNPNDVLWIGIPEESTRECIYQYQEKHMTIFCRAQDLGIVNNQFAIEFYCDYSPEDCNISHANIFSKPPLKTSFTKPQRRDIILKLASIFEEIE